MYPAVLPTFPAVPNISYIPDNRVIGNVNPEQLVLGLEWKSKIVIFISDEAEKFGGIQHCCLKEKLGYFTFYGGQHKNLVKY